MIGCQGRRDTTTFFLLLVVVTMFIVLSISEESSPLIFAAATTTTDDDGSSSAGTEIQFRSGATWGPTHMPHIIFQTAIWAGFFAAMVPDNGLIDFVTGRFRHKTRRYLELSGGVVAASLVGRVDMMMKIALLQVAASYLPYRPGGTYAPETMSPPIYYGSTGGVSSSGSLMVSNTAGDDDPLIQLTPNYLFFLTQAPMVYFLLKAGGAFEINNYYTAVMISATGIYSNLGFLLMLLLGQLAVKLVFSALNKNVNTSMASAYLHTLAIMTVPMAMHGAFYFTQEELLTLSQKPTIHTIIVGFTLGMFVLGLLGTLLSNGVPSAISSSRRVLSWWASEVSPTRGERLHYAWLVSMWLFSSIAGMIGGNWIGSIFDGRPPGEQLLFHYGLAALYFCSAVCNTGAVLLIPESRKLSVTAAISDFFLFVFSFPQINRNVVGVVMALMLFIWAFRALVVHLILPFIDSRTQIPIPEAHAEALRESATALLVDYQAGGSDSDEENESLSAQAELEASTKTSVDNRSEDRHSSTSATIEVDEGFEDDDDSNTSSPTLSATGASGGHSRSSTPRVSPGQSPPVRSAGKPTASLLVPPVQMKDEVSHTLIDPFDNLSDDDDDDLSLQRSTSKCSMFSARSCNRSRSSNTGGPGSIELQEILPNRGRVVGENKSPPPAWIRHLPSPQVEIQVHKRRTSILRRDGVIAGHHQQNGNQQQRRYSPSLLPTPLVSPDITPRGSFASPPASSGPSSLRDSFSLPPRSAGGLHLSIPGSESAGNYSTHSLMSQQTSGSYSNNGSFAGLKRKGVQFHQKDIEDPTKYGARKKGKKVRPIRLLNDPSGLSTPTHSSQSAAACQGGDFTSGCTADQHGTIFTSPVLHSATPPGLPVGGGVTSPSSPALLSQTGSFSKQDYIPPQAMQLKAKPVSPIETVRNAGTTSPSPQLSTASTSASPDGLGLGRLRSFNGATTSPSGSFSSGGGSAYNSPTSSNTLQRTTSLPPSRRPITDYNL